MLCPLVGWARGNECPERGRDKGKDGDGVSILAIRARNFETDG